MLSIRTQNRMKLVPYNNTIEIYESRKRTELKEWELTGICEITLGNVPLGTYSTKERALEVLDGIERVCNGKVIISADPLPNEKYFDYGDVTVYEYGTATPKYTQPIEVLPTVYQMPKDKEE